MSANFPKLSEGSIAKIIGNERVERPLLQILIYKAMPSTNAQTKYRFQLFDGLENGNTFIAVQPELIQRIAKGEFEKFTVVELKSYNVQNHQGMDRQIIIINDMSVVMSGSKIGKRLDKSSDTNIGLLSNVSPNNRQNLNTSANRPMNSKSSSASGSGVGSGVGSGNGAGDRTNVCPITAITPYFNAWLIKARVTSKAPKRNWSNAKGEGCVFSFDVLDESGEIRVNAFNKEVEKYYDLVQPNKVFYISKGTIKTANKRFSNLANDYEITLQSDSLLEETDELAANVPKMRYKFIKIKDLENISIQSIIDVIGIVTSIEEVVAITSKKTNKELKKRDLTLLDNTCHEVRFTLWNEAAESFVCELNSVVAIKNTMVGEFNGRTLGSVGNTTLQIDPDIPETNLLKDWFSREGSSVTTMSLSKNSGEMKANETRLLCQINTQSVTNDRNSYFNVTARITATGRQPLYRACGQNGCLKKVRDNNNGFYHCDKCQTDSPNFEWRLILSVAITDCTGDNWVTLFQDEAEKLLGIKVKDLSELQENSPQQFLKALSSAEFKKYRFRIGAKIDNYNEESRVKCVAYNFSPIDPIKRSKELIKKIKLFTQ